MGGISSRRCIGSERLKCPVVIAVVIRGTKLGSAIIESDRPLVHFVSWSKPARVKDIRLVRSVELRQASLTHRATCVLWD